MCNGRLLEATRWMRGFPIDFSTNQKTPRSEFQPIKPEQVQTDGSHLAYSDWV